MFAVVSVGSRRGYGYVAARLYEVVQAQAGHRYWKATGVVGPWRRGDKIVQQDAEQMAAEHNCPILGIRHGSPVKEVPHA